MSWLMDWWRAATVQQTVNLLSLAVVNKGGWQGFDWTTAEMEVERWWWWQRNEAARWAAREHLVAGDNDLSRLPRPKFFPEGWK